VLRDADRESAAAVAVDQPLVLNIGNGLPNAEPVGDHVVEGHLLNRCGLLQTDPAAAAELFGSGETQQLLQQRLEPVQLRGHGVVRRLSLFAHMGIEGVCAQADGRERVAQLV
jgi:hypothetical protein